MAYIYGFFDRNRRLFYVGQTVNFKNRVRGHRTELKRRNYLYCYNKLRKEIRDTGLSIGHFIKIIESDVATEDLDAKEISYIKKARQDGYKLTNLTNGGRGSSNYPKLLQKKCAKSRVGRKLSEETKRRISEARTGMVFSREHKNNLSVARRKRKTTEETRNKMRLASKGKINTKRFRLTDPSGKEYITNEGLTKFCEDNGLTTSLLHKVLNGERQHHRGWKAYKI